MNTANSLGAPLNSQVQVDQRLMFQEVHFRVHLLAAKRLSISGLQFEKYKLRCTS